MKIMKIAKYFYELGQKKAPAKIRWHSIGEKPKKDGEFLVRVVYDVEKCDSEEDVLGYDIRIFYNGQFIMFTGQRIVAWAEINAPVITGR